MLLRTQEPLAFGASLAAVNMWPCKNNSQIQVQLFTFSNPTHKLELGLK
jgi:hypothetical protein